jgi:sec-independent protein translocase protein TatC
VAAEETINNTEIDESEDEGSEMSFLEHLEELRWRIIYSLIGLVIGTIICWIFIDFLVDHILLIPATHIGVKLQNLRPFGQLLLYMQVAIIGGIVISIPNLFFQLWKFISPALKKNERKYITSIVIFSTFCFLTGIVFAYFLMIPLSLKFAAGFGSKSIENNFAIDEYFSIIISIMLASGVVFELPMVSFFLSKLGILKPKFMRKYRRHAIVVIFALSAVLTPGTDPVSQIVLAIPLIMLYEISILVCKIAQKKER